MNDTINNYNEGITLKDLILRLKEYSNEIFKSWIFIGLFCVVSVLGFVYKHYTHVPIYVAELRFVVEGQSGGGGGLGSLLGSFGIKKGGQVSPYKIIEVGKSTNLMIKTLSHDLGVNGNIANTILKEYELPEEWGVTNPDFENFKFGNEIDISGTKLERSAIKRLRSKVWGSERVEPMTQLSLNNETGIYSLSTKSISEELSLGLTSHLYNEIKYFFEEEVFRNQKQLADILTVKADSINVLNQSKIREIARIEDSNRGVVSNQAMVAKKILSNESMALNVAYTEIMKSKEMTDVNLKDMQPLFMAIDSPFSPIGASSSSIIVAILKGLLLGGFLSVFIIVLRRLYRDVMSN